MKPRDKALGIVSAMYAFRYNGRIFIHLSFGRVVDRLARRYKQVYLCVPLKDGSPPISRDYSLQEKNIEVVPQPFYASTKGALRLLVGIGNAYIRTCRMSQALFIRGEVPHLWVLYLRAWLQGIHPCLWVVGNPMALLRSHPRFGRLGAVLAMSHVTQNHIFARIGRWLTDGSILCNGEEIGRMYRSPRTFVTVSSTITSDEFFVRQDTCSRGPVRILFVSFVRPEKGLEYLIKAVTELQTSRKWELVIVGPRDRYPDYQARLDQLVRQLDIAERVRWEGYVPYGPELRQFLQRCDLFVLPTLSEGTPRILVEVRANSLPVVSTLVGGIPTSVTNGVDGLLVPPKNPKALALAIDRVIEDGELRRALIANGLASARRFTVDRFVKLAERVLEREIRCSHDDPNP